MISRRNIRVKVMQTLYTLATLEPDEQKNKQKGSRILNDKLDHALDLFVTSILYIIRAAEYSETDATQRASKYLPTAEDMNVSTKIAHNTFIGQILANKSFAKKVKDSNAERLVDSEWIKKIYQNLAKTDEYKKYVSTEEHNNKEDKEILQLLWEKEILGNEDLQSYFSDELPGWEDDAEMIAMLMQNFFKSNQKINFDQLLSPEKSEYAHSLLHTVLDKEDYCHSLINPKLKNWDPERVAYIDTLLLCMGICEFLYFPTIPTKVTINEYIEIAKNYSSPQSGQFINGVLDNVLKDLLKENKINKEERSHK